MKKIFLIFTLAILAACSPAKQPVVGEVFIITKGRDTVKLSGVTVRIIDQTGLSKDLKVDRSLYPDGKLPVNWSPSTLLEKHTVATIQTNADAKFETRLYAGDYLAHAESSRKVFDKTEDYIWLYPFTVKDENTKIMLNNSNLIENGAEILEIISGL